MQQLTELFHDVIANGTLKQNRTDKPAISLEGAALFFDVSESFPAVSTKKLYFQPVISEGIGFLNGKTSAKDFRDLGAKIWDQNANEEPAWLANPYRDGTDHLGPVYGAQWRQWNSYKMIELSRPKQIQSALQVGYQKLALIKHPKTNQDATLLYKPFDQVLHVLDQITNNPESRRILFHAWNCAEIDQMALPPCHLLYQFLPNPQTKTLSLCVYLRSNDLFLGAPFNIAQSAFFLYLFARFTGYRPKRLSYFIGDAHIYTDHLENVHTQMTREPYPSPTLLSLIHI